MRYKILYKIVTYGEWDTGSPNTKCINQSLNDCIEFIKGTGIDIFELNKWMHTPTDKMGCGGMYKVAEDRSVDTIWANLTAKEKEQIFAFLKRNMDIKGLSEKVKDYE